MKLSEQIEIAALSLKQGHIVAYPTEAVYGLGCDPRYAKAIKALYELKGRDGHKGVIIIGHDFDSLKPFLDLAQVPEDNLARVMETWPGPHTWVFPASELARPLTGENPSLAVRMTAHPIARALCEAFGGAIVSTSANLSNQPPAKSKVAVQAYFGENCFTIEGPLGHLSSPTPIQDALSLKFYRK